MALQTAGGRVLILLLMMLLLLLRRRASVVVPVLQVHRFPEPSHLSQVSERGARFVTVRCRARGGESRCRVRRVGSAWRVQEERTDFLGAGGRERGVAGSG